MILPTQHIIDPSKSFGRLTFHTTPNSKQYWQSRRLHRSNSRSTEYLELTSSNPIRNRRMAWTKGHRSFLSTGKARSNRSRRHSLAVCWCAMVVLLDFSSLRHSLVVSADSDPHLNHKTHTTALFEDNWEILETYPHDRASFTQGLEVHPSFAKSCDARSSLGSCDADGESNTHGMFVTESTGMHGDSLVRIWDLVSGKVHKESKLDSRLFGEGSTHYVDPQDKREKIAVLTYQEESILVYDAHTLDLIEVMEQWPSPTTTKEGWGIAFDPIQQLFMVTDGSEYLHFWNTRFQAVKPKIPVTIQELVAPQPDGTHQVFIPYEREDTNDNDEIPGRRINLLNELEWDSSTNTLLANRWGDQVVLRIDPTTGIVTRVYNFWNLYPQDTRSPPPENYRNEDVFNGVAIVPHTDGKEWLVTGKWWPNIYRIRIKE